MKYPIVVITLFYIVLLGFVTFRTTNAFFTDSATSQNNQFVAASQFPTATPSATLTPTPTGTPSANIVINEAFPHGNADDEWVELFNKSDSPIDISGWKITDEDSEDIIPTVSPIPAGGYAVIIAGDTNITPPGSAITIQLANAIGNSLNANNEGISLRKPDNSIIDGVNWGTVLTHFNPSATPPTGGQSLRRIPNGTDTNTAGDWSSGATSIGVAN
jgi:hypothetical protein